MDRNAIRCVASCDGLNMMQLITNFIRVCNPSNKMEIIDSIKTMAPNEYVIVPSCPSMILCKMFAQMYGGEEIRLLVDETRYFTLSFVDPNHGGFVSTPIPWRLAPPYVGRTPEIFRGIERPVWKFPCLLYKGDHFCDYTVEVCQGK